MKTKKASSFSCHDFIDAYISELTRCLKELDKDSVQRAINLLMEAYKNKKKIFIMGNGGSASTASHMACDLGKGTLSRIYDDDEQRFHVMSLTDNVAIMTALANDLTYEDIFIQQMRNLVEKDDIVILLSGSGNSENLIRAAWYAKKCGARTIGILGFTTGGKLGKMVDCAIMAQSNHYGPSEDFQLIIEHIIVGWIAKIKRTHDGLDEKLVIQSGVPFR